MIQKYDYIITKPELNEETLAHYGIKGMKWRRHKGRKKPAYRRSRRKVPGQEYGEALEDLFGKAREKLYENSKLYRKYTDWMTAAPGQSSIATLSSNAKDKEDKEEKPEEPKYAYDPETGEALYKWDAKNETWVPLKKKK